MRYRNTRISPRMAFRKDVTTGPRAVMEVGRNDPCPCGSGKKFKHCCSAKGDAHLRALAKKAKRQQEGTILSRLFKKRDAAK